MTIIYSNDSAKYIKIMHMRKQIYKVADRDKPFHVYGRYQHFFQEGKGRRKP